MRNKYQITDRKIIHNGVTLYQIQAIRSFGNVNIGDLGGFVQNESNLNQRGACWIYNKGKVYGEAKIQNNAKVMDEAEVYGEARIHDNALVADNAKVYENARIFGSARVFKKANVHGNVEVSDNALIHGDAEVFGNSLIGAYAIVYENAVVFGNADIHAETVLCEDAYISSNKDVITISSLDKDNGSCTFYINKKNEICVTCGCFKGDIDGFEDKVIETYAENETYKNIYLKSIDFAKDVFELRK